MTAWLDIAARPWGDGYPVLVPAYGEDVRGCLRPGDVLLVEGSSRISTVIQYLPRSSWSRAALFVGAAGVTAPAR